MDPEKIIIMITIEEDTREVKERGMKERGVSFCYAIEDMIEECFSRQRKKKLLSRSSNQSH